MAASAKLRLSYSADLLPLNRAVCISADKTPAGQVLATLLGGTFHAGPTADRGWRVEAILPRTGTPR